MLLVGALDTDVESAQITAEANLENLIKRGRPHPPAGDSGRPSSTGTPYHHPNTGATTPTQPQAGAAATISAPLRRKPDGRTPQTGQHVGCAGTIGAMTQTTPPRRATVANRWPTTLALPIIAGAITLIALLDREAELFGPSIATMAGIYLTAYAHGRPSTAWLAFIVLSLVVTALHLLARTDLLPADPGIGMTVALVPLWIWAVARRRFTDINTFSVQTAGMIGFGAIALLCATVQPRLGAALAGVGFLAHGIWDAYHFKANKVVNRPWSEFCAVIDLAVGVALLVAAA
jgi:hypothetical protein